MKRLTVLLAAALLSGGFAVADGAQVHGWGRAIFLPVIGTSEGTSQALGTSWGGDPRVGMEVSGSSADLGFQIKIIGDNATIAGDGVAKIWAKPTSWSMIEVGNFTNDTLNGGTEFGSASWQRLVDSPGTFTGIGVDPAATYKGAKNVALSVTPLPGLFAFADIKKFSYTEDSLRMLQYGAGYEIRGLGHFRAQVFGNETKAGDVVTNKGYLNGAAKLTFIPGLYADVGVFLPFDADASGYSLQTVAYANYALSKAKLHVLGNFVAKTEGDAAMEAGVGLDFDIGGGLSLTSDLRYQNEIAHGGDLGLTGGMLGLSKSLGGGVVGIGVAYSSTKLMGPGATFEEPNPDEAKQAHFSIPVKLEYYF